MIPFDPTVTYAEEPFGVKTVAPKHAQGRVKLRKHKSESPEARSARLHAFYKSLPAKKVGAYALTQVAPGRPDCPLCRGTGLRGKADRFGQYKICKAPGCAYETFEIELFLRYLAMPDAVAP